MRGSQYVCAEVSNVLENMVFTTIKPTTENRALSTTSIEPTTVEGVNSKHVSERSKTRKRLNQADTILPWTKTTSVIPTPCIFYAMTSAILNDQFQTQQETTFATLSFCPLLIEFYTMDCLARSSIHVIYASSAVKSLHVLAKCFAVLFFLTFCSLVL